MFLGAARNSDRGRYLATKCFASFAPCPRAQKSGPSLSDESSNASRAPNMVQHEDDGFGCLLQAARRCVAPEWRLNSIEWLLNVP
eukprot:12765641-Alexandrium_andersonii.AAC.1